MSHFIEKCSKCGTTISQCRCPDLNKTVKCGICAKCKEPPDRAMTRAEVEAIPERTALGWDDIAKLKAHTLALHDDRDSWRRVAERLEREKVALHDKLDRARELLRTADIEFRKLPESHSKDEWVNDFLAENIPL